VRVQHRQHAARVGHELRVVVGRLEALEQRDGFAVGELLLGQVDAVEFFVARLAQMVEHRLPVLVEVIGQCIHELGGLVRPQRRHQPVRAVRVIVDHALRELPHVRRAGTLLCDTPGLDVAPPDEVFGRAWAPSSCRAPAQVRTGYSMVN
jgi:hypothetical protein